MSLNWREIALVISELPLEGSLVQRVHQIGFHALVFELHSPREGAWELYVEVGTPSSRMHRISGPARQSRKRKTEKLQRFIQFIRAHVEGSRITGVSQVGNDRLIVWRLSKKDETLFLIIRLYSGPGANVIVCDEHMVIRELLFRRPAREETAGHALVLPQETSDDDGRFPVREHPADRSFNLFIEDSYRSDPEHEEPDVLLTVLKRRDEELALLDEELTQARDREKKTASYETYRHTADLLAANRHLIDQRAEWIEVTDHGDGKQTNVTIALDPRLSPGENIEAYYRKYHKGKTAWERAREETAAIEARRLGTESRFAGMLQLAREGGAEEQKTLLKSLEGRSEPTAVAKDPYRGAPGLRFISGAFTLLVGRNAKENEELLRRWARGNDWWMHTRDTPGGYVFIKSIAGKSIPLETLLDAANLALLYSKAKDAGKADLYYTQVKYLKRPKGGKTGLVIPTQEKNIPVQLDESRIKRLFSAKVEP